MNNTKKERKRYAGIVLVICTIINVAIRDRRAFFAFEQENRHFTVTSIVFAMIIVALLIYRLWDEKERALFETACCVSIITFFTVFMLLPRVMPEHQRILIWLVVGTIGGRLGVWAFSTSTTLVGKIMPFGLIAIGVACVTMKMNYNSNNLALNDYYFVFILFTIPRVAVFVCAILRLIEHDT